VQGLFICSGPTIHRPASKKAVKEALALDAGTIVLEATSFFGDEYEGPVSEAPAGKYSFVGPDPHTRRNFYGTIVVGQDGSIKVT
jgi:hypothetical protein